MRTITIGRVALLAGASLAVLGGGIARAQDTGTASAPAEVAPEAAPESEIVVTGTQIQGAQINDVLPVTVVDEVVDAKGTRKVAEAYLNFLYTPEAQKLIAKHYYRPSDPKSADPKDLARFVDVKLIAIDDPLFGGWAKAQPKHFADGGIFDQIYQPKSTN